MLESCHDQSNSSILKETKDSLNPINKENESNEDRNSNILLVESANFRKLFLPKEMVEKKLPSLSKNSNLDLSEQHSKLEMLFLRTFPYYINPQTWYEPKDTANKLEKLLIEPLFIKNGVDLYSVLFCLELCIFVFFIMFYDRLIGSSGSFAQSLAKNRFTGEMVGVIVIIIIVILINRICCTKKFTNLDHTSKSNPQTSLESHNIYNMIYSSEKEEESTSLMKSYEKETRPQKKVEKKQTTSKHALTLRFLVHLILVLIIHYFFFIKIPEKNKMEFSSLPAAKLCYSLFFIYFALSAIQIHNGFSPNDSSDSQKKEISIFENSLRHVYKAVPFIFEIKSVIDWSTTETSLDLFQWIKLEDAKLNLFVVKYQMECRRKYQQPIQFRLKLSMGWCFLLLLVGIAIFPLFLFSSLNPNYHVAFPLQGSLSLQIVTIQEDQEHQFELFSTITRNVSNISDIKFNEFKNYLNTDTDIKEDELKKQISNLKFDPIPERSWDLSPPRKKQLKTLLSNSIRTEVSDPDLGKSNNLKAFDDPIFIRAEWTLLRKPDQAIQTVEVSNGILLDYKNKRRLLRAIKSSNSSRSNTQ